MAQQTKVVMLTLRQIKPYGEGPLRQDHGKMGRRCRQSDPAVCPMVP
jgi:hypothetical protein